MPSLVVCSTKTPFSGDDLRFFCVCACLFRTLQLALGLSLIAYTTEQKNHVSEIENLIIECEEDNSFLLFTGRSFSMLYAQGSMSICLAIIGMCAAIPTLVISKRGTPTNSEPRKALAKLCYFNVSAMNIFRIIGFILSIFSTLIISQYCDCVAEGLVFSDSKLPLKQSCPNGSKWLGAMIALNVTHSIDAFVVVTQYFYLCCPKVFCPAILPSEVWWKACFTCSIACCSSLTCCCFGGLEALQGDFGDLALVISNYTANNNTIDVTLSDIAAGLVMVVRRQREQLLEARQSVHQLLCHEDDLETTSQKRRFSDPISSDREGYHTPRRELRRVESTPELEIQGIGDSDGTNNYVSTKALLSQDNPQERFFISEGARFMPMAQATYTWLIFLIEHGFFGLLTLGYLIIRRCACFSPSPRDKVVGDFRWEAHMAALEAMLGLGAEDIVFASFKESIAAVPYVIVLDHEWRSIVISIRGTLTLESIVADIAIRPEELSRVGEECGFDGKGRYCHRGVLKSSKWIYNDIRHRGKLKAIIEGGYKNYRLRIVGHSLGAACAAMLSVMLRPSHPNLRCLAFSPPGCVFSENLAEESSSWLTSFILDADIVPRLAIGPFENLRDSVLKMIYRIKVPKYKVFELSRTATNDIEELFEQNKAILYHEDEVPNSEFKSQVDSFLEFQAQLKQQTGAEPYISLHPPGKIIQLFRARHQISSISGWMLRPITTNRKEAEKNYVARWIHRDDLQHIIVSSHLVGDHEPTNVKHQIQRVAERSFDLSPPLYKMFGDMAEF